MKIGIISDIHDNLRSLSRAVEFFNSQSIELLLCCGDWDMPFSMRTMAQIKCPVKSVLGNGDPDIQKFQYQLMTIDMLKDFKLEISTKLHDFTVEGKRIAVTHGDDDNLNRLLIDSGIFDLVCMGHSHQPGITTEGKTMVINPGTLVGYLAESGEEPITVAIYDSEVNRADIVDLEKI